MCVTLLKPALRPKLAGRQSNLREAATAAGRHHQDSAKNCSFLVAAAAVAVAAVAAAVAARWHMSLT